nr:MAG TPA: Single strand binding protein [Caudoviricetes sp.]
MNSVILIGRLTRDPELVYTPGNQTAVTHFSIAVDRPTAQGKERQADFIRITTFGKQAENCDRYLHKGKQVAVNGRIQTGSYKNKEGQTVYTTDVIANNVEFLSSSQQGTPRQPDEAYSNSTPNYQDEMPDAFEATEEDIPF